MPFLTSRVRLGAFTLLIALLFTGCDDGGLTAPDQTAADATAFTAFVDQTIEAAMADDVPSAATVADQVEVLPVSITGPTVITEPGLYVVEADFSAEADGIVIQASGVFLDLNNHTITGPGNKEGRGVVIEGVQRVLVRGGALETFGVGVAVVGSRRVGVAGVRVAGGDEFADPANGVPPQVGFLLLDTVGARLLGNSAYETNLGFFVRGGGSTRNQLMGNLAQASENGLLGVCYNPAPDTPDPAGPSLDRVSNNVLIGFGTGIQASVGSAENRFASNVIYYLEDDYEDLNGSNVFVGNRTMQLPPS